MKKKIQKPFDVEAAKNGAVVETKDGRSVRIVCYDIIGANYPIIALVDCIDVENCLYYDIDGKLYGWEDNKEDLVIIEEVECPKFKVGDWVVRKDGKPFRNGNKFAQIKSIKLDGEMCFLDTGRQLYSSEIRHWTINDAQDGDLIYVSTEKKGIGAIFNKFSNGIICFHCYLCGDFTQGGYMPMGDVELIYPWQEIHHQRFFQKMREAGYEWNREKKELIRI